MVNKFKEIREMMGLTQDEFCEKIGTPKRTYIRYEKGERQAPADIIKKIAKLGNVSIEYLFGNQTISGNNNIQIQGGSEKNLKVKNELNELIELLEEYATPKLINEFKTKLLKIKELHEA